MTGRIFINYRRGDDQAAAGRLYDRLLQHFDREQLFMDVDAIEPGVDFVKSLDEQRCTRRPEEKGRPIESGLSQLKFSRRKSGYNAIAKA